VPDSAVLKENDCHPNLAEAIVMLTNELHSIHHDRNLAILEKLASVERTIMASQADLTKQVTDLTAQVGKVGTETRSLLTRITELLAVIAAGGDATPELTAAVAALQAQVQVVDDLVADAPPTP